MPDAMTVEIIKKYKGKETRKRVKIWGDNGMLCRHYIGSFKIGNYYLMAPFRLGKKARKNEKAQDYSISPCCINYLFVDYKKKKAFGNYASNQKNVGLNEFEQELLSERFKFDSTSISKMEFV